MKKVTVLVMAVLAFGQFAAAQNKLTTGKWRALLHRADGNDIVFNFQLAWQKSKPVLYILNAAEKLAVTDVQLQGDSMNFNMPFFESAFRTRIFSKDSISGVWVKATSSGKNIEMPFTASTRYTYRFQPQAGSTAGTVTGKWSVQFLDKEGKPDEPAIGVFTQKGKAVTGSILTPTGDYRFLEGRMNGNTLLLSTFDGSHAFVIRAELKEGKLTDGMFYAGLTSKQGWTAVRNDTATLPDLAAMYVKKGEEGYPDFRFKDMEGKEVSIKDDRFKNKVVIIQLMGSWCPNCMDETAFLSEYYRKNQARGVEIVALAYEYTTDFNRSQQSLRKFQQRFNVTYPILITGVSVTDTLRTEKTLPQFTRIKSFPTSIILDRTGKVRKIDNGFVGPGTGAYFTTYKNEFEKLMNELLAEGAVTKP
ncbi:peroxiredoxin family protein [Filimonas lacunae]|nr:TlpA disulfide reductase family protein [Filimonas lacunae]